MGAGMDSNGTSIPWAEGPVFEVRAGQGPMNHRSGACGLSRCYSSEFIDNSRMDMPGETSADCCRPEWVGGDQHRLQVPINLGLLTSATI